MRSFFMRQLLPFVLLFCACNENSSNTTASNDKMVTSQTIHNNVTDTVVTSAKPIMLNGCYQMILKHDTTILRLNLKDSTVTGDLRYNFYQKDDNTGTIKGVLRGDTIDADYTFKSEGMISVREVIFKIQDTTLLQGYGDVKEQKGKVVFQDKHTLQFQTANPFVKINCR